MKSLFTDNFPFITTDTELEVLKAKYPKYDPYYITSGSVRDRHDKFDALYQKYHPYADRHFLTEVKKRFHQRTWEMYLGCTLLDKGISFSSKDKGPDILIKHQDKSIWIECVACEKGDGADRVPEVQYGIVQSVPVDEMLIRMASALKAKYEQYKKYIKDGTVKDTDQFIIAISAGAFDHAYGNEPLILRNLFALGHPTLTFPVGGGIGLSQSGWSTVSSIKKKNGSDVPMTFFLEKQHEGISAVIYCRNSVLSHSDVLGEDTILVYNPLAKNPLPEGVLDSFKYYKIDSKGNLRL